MNGEKLKRYRVSFRGMVSRFTDVIAHDENEAEQVAYEDWRGVLVESVDDPEWVLESIRETDNRDGDIPVYVARQNRA